MIIYLISDNGLIFRIDKILLKLNNNNTSTKNPIQKYTKDLNSPSSKEEIQMADKDMKRCQLLAEFKSKEQ